MIHTLDPRLKPELPALRGILVPLDGSELAEQALPVGAAHARRTGATLHLVSVHEPVPQTAMPPDYAMPVLEMEREVHEERVRYLETVAASTRASLPTPVVATVVTGGPAESLSEYVGDPSGGPRDDDDPRARWSESAVAWQRSGPDAPAPCGPRPAAAPRRSAPAHRVPPSFDRPRRRDRGAGARGGGTPEKRRREPSLHAHSGGRAGAADPEWPCRPSGAPPDGLERETGKRARGSTWPGWQTAWAAGGGASYRGRCSSVAV